MPDSHPDFAHLSASVATVVTMAGELNASLSGPAVKLERAERVLEKVRKLTDEVNKVHKVIVVLRTALTALDGIPFVDILVVGVQQVLSVAANLFGKFNKVLKAIGGGLVAKLAKGLAGLRSGIRVIGNTLTKISSGGETFSLSLKIVSTLHIAVAPLANFSGGPWSALTHTLEIAESAVTFAIRPVEVGLTGALGARAALVSMADTIADLEVDALETATSAVSSLFDTLRPIHECIENILSSVKPLQWLFDAAEWLSEHILQPVIDAILDACGISKILQSLAEEFGGGLKSAMELLSEFTKVVNVEAITELLGYFGEGAAKVLAEHWSELSGALAAYRPNADGSFRDVLLRIFQVVQQQLAGPMPDWPVEIARH